MEDIRPLIWASTVTNVLMLWNVEWKLSKRSGYEISNLPRIIVIYRSFNYFKAHYQAAAGLFSAQSISLDFSKIHLTTKMPLPASIAKVSRSIIPKTNFCLFWVIREMLFLLLSYSFDIAASHSYSLIRTEWRKILKKEYFSGIN